jgi:hypothetical protein
MEPFEQPVESDEANVSGEDAVKAGAQDGLVLLAGVLAIGLEIAIEPPDQITSFALGFALLIGEGVKLVDQALGMNLIQSSG